jgi:hypothetical protein
VINVMMRIVGPRLHPPFVEQAKAVLDLAQVVAEQALGLLAKGCADFSHLSILAS